MPDNVVKIGAIVDTQTVADGTAASGAAVQSMAQGMTIQFDELASRTKRAWGRISDEIKAGADVASAQAKRVAELTKDLAAADNALSAAKTISKDKDVEGAASTSLLAAAQERRRAVVIALSAAEKELAGTELTVAAAGHRAVTDVQATSAAIRTFEGNGGIRALEVFISRTLGAGGAMQKIFPLVGAALFAGALIRGGEEAYQLEQKAAHAGVTIAEAFSVMHDKAGLSIIDLQIENDKLDEQIAKVSGHPGNGLAVALDEAIKRAYQLQTALREDRKELEALFKDNAVGMAGSFLSGVQGTGQQQKELLKDNQAFQDKIRTLNESYVAELKSAKSDDEQRAAGQRHADAVRAAFASQITAYQVESARLKKEQDDSKRLSDLAHEDGRGTGVNAIDNSAKLANLKGVTDQLRDRATQYDLIESLAGNQEKLGELKQDKPESESKAGEEAMRAAELQLDQMKQLHSVTLKEEHDFWDARKESFAGFPSQYKSVMDKITAIDQEGAKKAGEGIRKFKESQAKDADQAATALQGVQRSLAEVNKAAIEQAEDVTRSGERWEPFNREVAKGLEQQAQAGFAMDEANLRINEQTGALRPLAAAQEQAKIHAKEYSAEIAILRKELERLNALTANAKHDPKTGALDDPKLASQIQQAQNALNAAQAKGGQQSKGDQAAITAATAKPYLTAFDQINNGWLKVQNDLLQGNRRIGRDFAEMGLSLAQSAARSAEQMLANFVRSEIRQVAAHRAANLQKNESDGQSAAIGDAIHKQSAFKGIFTDAKSAAAGAFKAVAGIPFVGPVLAPIAAGAAFAGVMSLAAFEAGGIVNGTPGMGVPILAHAGERVLTTTQTNNFERMVNNNTTGGGGVTNHFNMGGQTFHGEQGGYGDFERQFKRTVKKAFRSMDGVPSSRSLLKGN